VDIAQRKHQLRAVHLAARSARSAADLAEARAEISAHVLTRCAESAWGCIAAYEPLRTEPGSIRLLGSLITLGVRVLVPVLLPDRDLDWHEWQSDNPPLGVAGVTAADAVLVPALAVDRFGTRLGRGGGSYDRALRRIDPEVPRAALLFEGELVDRLPADDWDERVTSVVMPFGWLDMPG
jgi:5-formyltetrahydrofolate cyclo-ligase